MIVEPDKVAICPDKVDLIEKNAHKIAENPSKLWKKFEHPCEYIFANSIPEPEWINCYKYEFSSPNPAFEKGLSACLKKTRTFNIYN